MTSPEYSSRQLYDLIWENRSDNPDWSKGRFEKLNDLIGTLNIRGKRVLDVCCGMGSKAYAALELGAHVWAFDGSVEGPNLLKRNVENQTAISERIKSWRRYKFSKPDVKNLTIIPGIDIANITQSLDNQQFDIVYMGWALMHVQDPESAVTDLQKLTIPGGTIAVSYYHQNYYPKIKFDIRDYTYGLPLEEVAEITAKLGKRWGYEKTTSLHELFKQSDGNQTLSALKKLMADKNYSIDEVENALHIEDMLTPYLYNLDDDYVVSLFETHSKVVYRRPGLIRAKKL